LELIVLVFKVLKEYQPESRGESGNILETFPEEEERHREEEEESEKIKNLLQRSGFNKSSSDQSALSEHIAILGEL